MTSIHLEQQLLSHYVDTDSLNGVEDAPSNSILLTTKSVVKQIKLQYPTQIRSWSSKTWHPFTAAAIYRHNEIIGVINNQTIVQWHFSETDVEKAAKFNVGRKIFKLLNKGANAFVVFTSGQVSTLAETASNPGATETRVLTEEDRIIDVNILPDNKTAILIYKRKKGHFTLCKVSIGEEKEPQYFKVSKPQTALCGIHISNEGKVLSLWTDGSLHHLDVNEYITEIPGSLLGNISSVLKCTKSAKIVEVKFPLFAIMGMDANEEGGCVLFYDVNFGVVKACKKLKIYHNPPICFNVNLGVVVAEGGSLSFIKLHNVENISLLSPLIGSKDKEESNSEDCYVWTSEMEPSQNMLLVHKEKRNSSIQRIIDQNNLSGYSERVKAGLVFTKILKEKNVNLTMLALEEFHNIPESSLVSILDLFLSSKDKAFHSIEQQDSVESPDTMEEEDSTGGDSEDDKLSHYCEDDITPYGHAKSQAINLVLKKYFHDCGLTESLSLLSFDQSMMLMSYLSYLLGRNEVDSISEKTDSHNPTVKMICRWISLLLDANYNQLVMSSEVKVHKCLLSCFGKVGDVLTHLRDLNDVISMTTNLMNRRNRLTPGNSSIYSIERIIL